MRTTPILLAMILSLAGCAAPAPPHAAAARTMSFGTAIPVLDSCFGGGARLGVARCTEPNVAVDGHGRILVADGATSDIAVSEDNGSSWTRVKSPPFPLDPLAVQSDILLQASPSGRVYYSAIVLNSYAAQREGIQVAWTDDGGATWTQGAYQTLAERGALVVSPDRQWLAFGAGPIMYLSYHQQQTGLWIARSDDEGRSWTGWTNAVPANTDNPIGDIGGPPVVEATGRVFLADCRSGAGASTGTVFVYTSNDKGATWAARGASAMQGCIWFPMLTLDGGLLILSSVSNGGLFTATSGDGGRTWTSPVSWAAKATISPWLLAHGGMLTMAYFGDDRDTASLHVARGTIMGPTQDVTIAAVTKSTTDFASIAALADGRLVTVWTPDRTADLVAVSR